jgi:hypothetical protein
MRQTSCIKMGGPATRIGKPYRPVTEAVQCSPPGGTRFGAPHARVYAAGKSRAVPVRRRARGTKCADSQPAVSSRIPAHNMR